MYSTSGHHPHPLGYLCAKFCFFRDLQRWACPWRILAYSINQSLTRPAYLMPRELKHLRYGTSTLLVYAEPLIHEMLRQSQKIFHQYIDLRMWQQLTPCVKIAGFPDSNISSSSVSVVVRPATNTMTQCHYRGWHSATIHHNTVSPCIVAQCCYTATCHITTQCCYAPRHSAATCHIKTQCCYALRHSAATYHTATQCCYMSHHDTVLLLFRRLINLMQHTCIGWKINSSHTIITSKYEGHSLN